MHIHQHQLDHLQQRYDNEFVSRILPLLQDELPEHCNAFAEGQLRAYLHQRLQDTDTNSIEQEDDIYRFMRVMVVLGPSYVSQPLPAWVTQPLRSPARPTLRVDALIDEVVRQLLRPEAGSHDDD